MKSFVIKTTAIALTLASLTACNSMTHEQRNTAAGAVIGGVLGHTMGGDTGATLGGAALGGVIGSQIK